MAWKPYNLDHHAMLLVQNALCRDAKSLSQAFKMRTTCAYGMERFWGEHLRLMRNRNQLDRHKGRFIAETWQQFRTIMIEALPALADKLPNTMDVSPIQPIDAEVLSSAVDKLWSLTIDEQRTCLAVLTNLCDAIVWWTQRLKTGQLDQADDDHDTE